MSEINTKISDIVFTSCNLISEKTNDFTTNSTFFGKDALLESIEAVQIIATIEDKLEEIDIEGFDLFDQVFSIGNCTVGDIINLIQDQASE